jgi:hypothetical protein
LTPPHLFRLSKLTCCFMCYVLCTLFTVTRKFWDFAKYNQYHTGHMEKDQGWL